MIFKKNYHLYKQKPKRMKTKHEKTYIDTCIDHVVEYMKSEKLPGSDAIRQIYESNNTGKKVENYLEGKKNKEEEMPTEKGVAVQLYCSLSQDNYNSIKKVTDGIGKVITSKIMHLLQQHIQITISLCVMFMILSHYFPPYNVFLYF